MNWHISEKGKLLDSQRTVAVVFCYKDGDIRPEIREWLFDLGITKDDIIYSAANDHDISITYNSGVYQVLYNTDAERFIFIDADMEPNPNSMLPFFEAKEDVVCVKYPTGNPSAWDLEGAFHCGIWRSERAILQDVWNNAKQLFKIKYKNKGMSRRRCLCENFAKKVRKAGYSVSNAGECMHKVKNPSRPPFFILCDEPKKELEKVSGKDKIKT